MELHQSLENLAPTRRQWRAWTCKEPVLAGRTFAQLRAALLDHHVSPEAKDDWLAALVRLADVDRDAGLAIVACLIPGLRRMVRRFAPAMEADDAWGEIVLALWEKVVGYDLARRPRRIAANLLWDTVRPLRRAAGAHREWNDRRRPLNAVREEHTDLALTFDGLRACAVDAGIMTPLDATLIGATRLGGLRLDHTAHLLGIDYEAAKKRRQRAEAAWAAWWVPDSPAGPRVRGRRCRRRPTPRQAALPATSAPALGDYSRDACGKTSVGSYPDADGAETRWRRRPRRTRFFGRNRTKRQ